MGGLLTVIGTSTNLVVQGLVLDERLVDPSIEAIGFFEPAYIGIPLGVVGMLYLVIFAPRILPSRGGLFRYVRDRAKELLTEVRACVFVGPAASVQAACRRVHLAVQSKTNGAICVAVGEGSHRPVMTGGHPIQDPPLFSEVDPRGGNAPPARNSRLKLHVLRVGALHDGRFPSSDRNQRHCCSNANPCTTPVECLANCSTLSNCVRVVEVYFLYEHVHLE